VRATEAARAAALAGTNHGFLTARILDKNGFDVDLACREVEAKRWQRPMRGFYVPHADTLDEVLLARLATTYAGPQSLLSGLVAARALSMRWIPDQARVHVLVPADVRRASTSLVRLRRCAGIGKLDAWSWCGVRVAPANRVVLDGAMTLATIRDVRGLVLGAVADGLAHPATLRGLLGAEPRNGTALLRRALTDAEAGAASPPEAEMADLLHGCGFPYLLNPELRRHGRLIGFPDGYFPGLGAGWEVDSRERHEGDDSFDETLARHGTFAGHGLVLAHPTPRRIRQQPSQTTAAVLAVARARHLLPPGLREPDGLEVIPRGPLQN